MTDGSSLLAEVLPLPKTTERRHRGLRLRPGTLRRERLLRRLAQSTHVPLTLLVAPAGYGKTTLLAHWLQEDPRAVAWIELDEADDDAGQLVTSVAFALELAAVEASTILRVPAATPAELSSWLEQQGRPFVLVLDDVHRLRSPAALAAVMAIADAVPAGSQVVLAGRGEPELPIGRLRAQGRLIDLRTRDLAMTRREAMTMLSLAGLELPREDVLLLLERTEGWPAGLYLAALSLRGRPDVHRAAGRFGGDDRLVADYLRDELLATLEDEQLAFLQRTAVLDELSGAVCDAILDRTGSGTRAARHVALEPS